MVTKVIEVPVNELDVSVQFQSPESMQLDSTELILTAQVTTVSPALLQLQENIAASVVDAELYASMALSYKNDAETAAGSVGDSVAAASGFADAADASRILAEAAKVAAEAAKTLAEGSATSASSSAANADTAKIAAETAVTSAQGYATTASDKATEAAGSATAANTAKTLAQTAEANASGFATAAETSKTQAYQYKLDAEAAKTAAEAAVGAGTGGLYMAGNWDASSGNPPPTPSGGSPFYKITVAGTIGGISYGVGDSIVYDNIGISWFKIDNTESVTSVAGRQGVVTLTASDISGLGTAATANTTEFEPSGSLASHTAAANPHNQYELKTSLGTAAYQPATSFATAAQGSKADTAVQPASIGTAAAKNAPVAGNAATTEVVLGSDTRLTDSREWTGVTVTQAEAEAGTSTTRRAWTPERVKQAILALAPAGGGGTSDPVTTTTNGLMLATDKVKLDGIAAGATLNASDASLRDRSTHTGTQSQSSITNLTTDLAAKIPSSEKGVANGVATLDADGLVPTAQLPAGGTGPHDHDDRYYTETESDAKYIAKAGTSDITGALVSTDRISANILTATKSTQTSNADLDNLRDGSDHSVSNITNGPTSETATWWHLKNQRGSENYCWQMVTGLTTETSVYWRMRDTGVWMPWRKMWDSTNHGSGSGLDADKLDSLEASQFVRSDVGNTVVGKWKFNDTSSLSLSTDGAVTIGAVTGINLGIDTDGIQARNNGVASSLGINSDGGDITLGHISSSVTVPGNFVVTGNLTVSGTTTTVNTETINLADNIITLNSNYTGSTPTEHGGIEIERGTLLNVGLQWNETSDKWECTEDGTTWYDLLHTGSTVNASALGGNASTYYQQKFSDIGSVELGSSLTGDRASYIDLHADDTNTDYSARLYRGAGVNGKTQLVNLGTGQLEILNLSSSVFVQGTRLVFKNVADGVDSFRASGTNASKFFAVRPETVTDTCAIGYWTGTAWATLELRGTLLNLGESTTDQVAVKGSLSVASTLTAGSALVRTYSATDTAITGLVGGSTSGSIVEGKTSGHTVIGVRGDDSNDSFSVLGTNTANSSYDKNLFQVKYDGTLTTQGNTLWHQGNDGAGSGLDADLLDGLQASVLVRNDLLTQQTLAGELTPTKLTYTGSKQLTAGTDLDTITVGGFYDCSNPVNAPTADVAWWYLEVQRYSNDFSHVMQKITMMNASKKGVWYRLRAASVWGSWIQLLDENNMESKIIAGNGVTITKVSTGPNSSALQIDSAGGGSANEAFINALIFG